MLRFIEEDKELQMIIAHELAHNIEGHIEKKSNNFILGNHSHMTATGSSGIFIGNDVSIARGTYLHASNHIFEDLNTPIRDQGVRETAVVYNKKNFIRLRLYPHKI